MKRLLPAVAIVALLILPQAARAQYYDQDQLAKVKEINVQVDDGVKDGCLPSPNVLKVEAELILRQSGITVTDQRLSPVYTLDITPFGFALKSGINCIVSVRFGLWRFETLIDQTSALVLVARGSSVLIWPKSELQKELRDFVNETVTALANEILKARAQ